MNGIRTHDLRLARLASYHCPMVQPDQTEAEQHQRTVNHVAAAVTGAAGRAGRRIRQREGSAARTGSPARLCPPQRTLKLGNPCKKCYSKTGINFFIATLGMGGWANLLIKITTYNFQVAYLFSYFTSIY